MRNLFVVGLLYNVVTALAPISLGGSMKDAPCFWKLQLRSETNEPRRYQHLCAATQKMFASAHDFIYHARLFLRKPDKPYVGSSFVCDGAVEEFLRPT